MANALSVLTEGGLNYAMKRVETRSWESAEACRCGAEDKRNGQSAAGVLPTSLACEPLRTLRTLLRHKADETCCREREC